MELPPPGPPRSLVEVLEIDLDAADAAQAAVAEDRALIDRLVGEVLDHFQRNRPEPASFPSIAAQVIDLVEDPRASAGELSRLVGNDPAISARILQIANSSYYARSQEIETVRMAVTMLGLREVAGIAAGVAGRSLFDVETVVELGAFRPRFGQLFHQAMTVAYGASWLAVARRLSRADRAFLSGMLHDIGKALALHSFARLTVAGKVPAHLPDAVTDEVVERAHLQLGGETVAIWSLPMYLVNACVRHHEKALPTENDLRDVHIVRVISGLVALRQGTPRVRRTIAEVEESGRALGLDDHDWPVLVDRVDDLSGHVASLFNL